MFTPLKIVLAAIALAGAPVGYVFYQAVLSPDSWTYRGALQTIGRTTAYIMGPLGPLLGPVCPSWRRLPAARIGS